MTTALWKIPNMPVMLAGYSPKLQRKRSRSGEDLPTLLLPLHILTEQAITMEGKPGHYPHNTTEGTDQ
jgi:hypothetical protein